MTTPTFTEDWFPGAACENLAAFAKQTNGLDGRVIEVGCWEGKSTIALANAVEPSIVDCVDTWAGSPGEPSETLAAERDVWQTFVDNLNCAGVCNTWISRMDWREFFAKERGPVRFLFIDAEHSYREVFDLLATALPLMVPGGMIVGDDVHHPPIREALVDTFGPEGVPTLANLWYWQVPE